MANKIKDFANDYELVRTVNVLWASLLRPRRSLKNGRMSEGQRIGMVRSAFPAPFREFLKSLGRGGGFCQSLWVKDEGA